MAAQRLRLAEIASRIGGRLHGDGSVEIAAVAPPQTAGPDELAPLFSSGELAGALLERARRSGAAAFLVAREQQQLDRPQISCSEVRRALALLIDLFFVSERPPARVDPRAAVDATATVDPSASVAPFCAIGPRASVGPGCVLEPHVVVAAGAVLGPHCWIGARAVIGADCRLGARCRVGPGAVVGHDGFGYWRDGSGWQRIRSAGSVEIGSDVDLGANSCVDRATLGATRLGDGVKIDNLVQVGHNARLEAEALLCAQVGLAGSAVIERGAVLGGQVGVADHVRIGAGGRVGAGSGVARDVAAGRTVSGYPAIAHASWLRASGIFARLGKLVRQVRQLRQDLDQLRDSLAGE